MRDNSLSFYNVSETDVRIRVYRLTPALHPALVWDFSIGH